MSYARKNAKNLSLSIVGVVVIIGIALWQFYEFVNFESVTAGQTGTAHLWWAIAMAIFACIAGVLVFSAFLRHDADDELHITASPHAARIGR
jgi:H+/Cl- antiporter ClcA